jgi:hypothetical protein
MSCIEARGTYEADGLEVDEVDEVDVVVAAANALKGKNKSLADVWLDYIISSLVLLSP